MNKKDLKEFYRIFAQKGGEATKKKYGKEHFSKMGKKSGESKRLNKKAQQGHNISEKLSTVDSLQPNSK